MAREASENRDEVDSWERLERHARDLLELEQLVDADAELAGQVQEEQVALERELHQRELGLLFADLYADHNAVMSITVGQGGVDAQDWVEILVRMYTKWAAPSPHERASLRPGCDAGLLDTAAGEEAGLKGATVIFRGRRATDCFVPSTACTVWSESHPSTRTTGDTRHLPWSRSCPSWTRGKKRT